MKSKKEPLGRKEKAAPLKKEWKLHKTLKSIKISSHTFLATSLLYFSKEGDLFAEEWLFRAHGWSYEASELKPCSELTPFFSWLEGQPKAVKGLTPEAEQAVEDLLLELEKEFS